MPLPTVSSSEGWLGPSRNPEASSSSLQLEPSQGLSLQFHRFPCTLWLSIGVTGSGSLKDRQSLRNTLEPGEEEKVIEKAAQAPSDDWAHPVHLWEERRHD